MPRQCDGCTMCCRLIAVPDLDKPQGSWCKYCQVGVGCKIQNRPERPKACGDFECLWLQGYGSDAMRPDKTKVVMSATTDGKSIVLHVDPSRPDAHRAPIFEKMLTKLHDHGTDVFVVCGDKRTLIPGRPRHER